MANPSKWIRTERAFSLPDSVRRIYGRLDDAGFVTYVVGGSVRDFLLGRPIKDYDLVTHADPDQICELFPDSVTVGKAFGVIKVPVREPSGKEDRLVEVATFREDLEYRDHRHPIGVRFAGPEEDARRRDFTINALFFDPKTSRILDEVGGLEDLKAGILRAIGDPVARFKEDALRLLRAVRFCTRFGFQLDADTEAAIRAKVRLAGKVSAERIRDELTWMVISPASSAAVRMLDDLGLLAVVLPDARNGLPRSVRMFQALDRSEGVHRRTSTLGWAVLLQGLTQVAEQGGVPALVHRVCEKVKLSRLEADRVAWLVAEHRKAREVYQMREATLQRFLSQEGIDDLLEMHRADALATDGNLVFHEYCVKRLTESRAAKAQGFDARLLKGEDLVQLGLRPGPKFSEILRVVEDLALERKLSTKEEALEYVLKHFVS
jgi:poly(A) polymerase